MKSLKFILFLLLFLLLAGSSYVAVQPNSYDLSRTRTISAPVSVIYNTVEDFRQWEPWSPWKEKEPTLYLKYPEKTAGVGGSYSWTGKDGKGTMKTLVAVPNDSLLQELKFEQFPASQVYWNFEYKSPNSTEVTWGMKSDDVPFVLKFFALISGGMDKMIGPDYEKGLENLDTHLQKQMAVYSIEDHGVIDYGGGFYLYVTSSTTPENISMTMEKNYAALYNYMSVNNIESNGHPMSLYQFRNPEDGSMIMSCAIPVRQNYRIKDASGILCGYMPRTKTLKTTLKGNYKNLEEAWAIGYQNMTKMNLRPSKLKPFEIYLTNPQEKPNPANWVTELLIPILN